jgi:hypothetical protein
LDDFFGSLDGYKVIFLTEPTDSQRIKFQGRSVVAGVYLAPWALSALSNADHMQLDGSFRVTKPFVYVVPQAVIHNEGVPLGFAFGPTESFRLYTIIRDALFDNGFPSEMLRSLPLLSDEGKALIKYGQMNHEKHFFCICHLIRKFGTGTPASLIVRRVAFVPVPKSFIRR